MNLKQNLLQILKGEVRDDPKTLDKYSRDTSLFDVEPSIVVSPKSTEDIKALVHFVNNNPGENLSLTARSGGTDMTGGPLTQSIVVDIQTHLNKIIEINNQDNFAITEPGAWFRDFDEQTTKHNLILPPYPASKDICTVGGMVANNSAGEKTLSYGKIEDYIQELNVILHDGNEYTFRPLNQTELNAKLQQQNFEGELYRQIYELIENNYDAIQAAKPKVSKNSAGYFLWNVWDKTTFDLTKLFTGSQGTLGIITKIKFRLIEPKPHSRMLVIFLRDLTPLADIIKTVMTYDPETFESYDDHTMNLAIRFLPDLWKKMQSKNLLSLIWSFRPEMRMILTGGPPKLILLAEFSGHDPKEIKARTQAARMALKKYSVKTHITSSDSEVQKYWTIRRESFNLLRQKIKNKRTAPFIDDFIVNPDSLPKFLPRLNDIMKEYDITYTIAGHVGNGNFHIIPLMDPTRKDFTQIIEELSKKVYDLVLEFDGSITAEHNDGLIRTHYLKQMYGEEIYNLFVQTKNIFDPNNIFNPGKKVGSNWEEAKKHIIRTLD